MKFSYERFLCLFLMIKYTSKTMDEMDYHLAIEVNYKKTVILIAIQKSFFVKQIDLILSLIRTAFLSSILNLKSAKHLKKS